MKPVPSPARVVVLYSAGHLGSALTMTAMIGTRLLRRVIRQLQSNQPAVNVLAGVEESTDDYYPMPGNREFESYFQQRRFFRIRDVLGLIAFRGLRR